MSTLQSPLQLARKYGMSQSGMRYRLSKGIPADAPLKNGHRGGNFKIDRAMAVKVWRGVCAIRRGKKESRSELAKRLGVTLAIVSNIADGRSWNSVTGLPKRQYDDC